MTDDTRERRIEELEQELRALRSSMRTARRPRAATLTLAFAVVAASLPLATWLHFAEREESARRAEKAEYTYTRKLQIAKHRHERHLEFVDAALSPEIGEANRAAALRFLQSHLPSSSPPRKWATSELPEVERTLAETREQLDGERTRLRKLLDDRDAAVEQLACTQGPASTDARMLVDALDREIAAVRSECARLERRIAGRGD